ncbi:MAG: HAMP domain-containing histidine kinase [Clostridia bacterium]|nr:HAMP domain-containing histidine kinase [Clostridia bacterium]
MIKSVFTRYMVFIALLLVFSFGLLVITLSVMVSEYSERAKGDAMTEAAEQTARAIAPYRGEDGLQDIPAEVAEGVRGYADVAVAFVYVLGDDGALIVTNDPDFAEGTAMMSSEVVESVKRGSSGYGMSRIENTFSEKRFNKFSVITNTAGESTLVILSSPSSRATSMSAPLIRTLIVGTVWILFASCITVYILLQRIIDPLKSLSDAARAFAKGDFKKRVAISGNDEVAEVGKAFNNMASVLEKNEEMRNSFIGSVSHDLRTPMTVIQGYVDGIRDGTIPEEKHGYYLDIISSEVKRLSRLVNSLLQITRMQSGEQKYTLARFNISEKARQVLISLEKRIDDKALQVDFDNEEDLFVYADTDAVHQVLYNLMENAVKFVDRGGSLRVRIFRDEDKARVRVENSGEGIPADELPHVFERFYKSDRSRGLDKTGTGLGLYIAKTNIEKMGGGISVDSVPGENTRFEFYLPLANEK